MSPGLQVLYLIVLVMQSFETKTSSPRFKYKTPTQELDFKVSACKKDSIYSLKDILNF